MTDVDYVHGYSTRESTRLDDQAAVLTRLLHGDTVYPAGSKVLEAGCAVGAQTVILARNSPDAQFTSIDISATSLAEAQRRVAAAGQDNVTFQQADIFDLPFADGQFDHVFVSFVLEHLADPEGALRALVRVLAPGGSITVIEGDHGSAYFHPDGVNARRAIGCLIDLQARSGGDSLIGRRLYPLLSQAGYQDITVWPRMVYVDDSQPDLVEGFTRNTFTAMVEGVGEQAVQEGLIDQGDWSAGIAELYRTAAGGGTFCYTFFKGVARRAR
jgi:ubiquinone/menaquinone biosynthesis C-methylase UbiE